MDSFELNKIIAAILLVALIIIGIGKISDVAFHVDKPEKSAYKVETLEGSSVIETKTKEVVEKVDIAALLALGAVSYPHLTLPTIYSV